MGGYVEFHSFHSSSEKNIRLSKSTMSSNPPSVRMHFCKECNNLMYAVESSGGIQGSRLEYRCRQCNFTEESRDKCVFRTSYATESQSLIELVEQDVVNDPTLSRDENKVCEKCGEKGCVFFQAHGDDDDAMALIFMCINCKQKWIG